MQGKKDGNNRTLILQRLTGHSGVIFAINFNKQGTLLSSVSDDRSIRLWKITNLSALESNGSVEPLLVVYGHSARVWNAKLLEMCFVSIGEDLVCNVWSYDGSIVKSYKGHTGIRLLNPLHLNIIMHILYTVLYTFLKMYRGEFVLQSKASLVGDHLLFSPDLNVWFRGEKLDASHS